MGTQALEAAIASTHSVLVGVPRDQLERKTPCVSWTVAELINHIVGGQNFFRSAAVGEPPSGGGDYASGDFITAFEEASAACVAAFQADGIMNTTLTLPFGQLPGSAVVSIAATDTFTHGWDLARATGQATDLDPELASGLLAGARQFVQPALRGTEGQKPFGPEQLAPHGASEADRLAAFLGRAV